MLAHPSGAVMFSLIIKLTAATLFALGLFGIYHVLIMPLRSGGMDCVCEIFNGLMCLYSVPPLLVALTRVPMSLFLLMRNQTCWAWARVCAKFLIGFQVLTLFSGVLFYLRLSDQIEMPVWVWWMSLVMMVAVALVDLAFTCWVMRFLKTPRVRQLFVQRGNQPDRSMMGAAAR